MEDKKRRNLQGSNIDTCRGYENGKFYRSKMKDTNKCILIDEELEGTLFSTGFFHLRPDDSGNL